METTRELRKPLVYRRTNPLRKHARLPRLSLPRAVPEQHLPRRQRWQRTWLRLQWALVLQPLLLGTIWLALCTAQITLDGSLGGPPRALHGPNYRIPAKAGQLLRANLFHSFDQFNVLQGESATFTGPGRVDNIIGRITGGQFSVIDGRLRSTIPGANLYLLNPQGILFGPKARLDVKGSVHVSTADYMRFANGDTFAAHLGTASTLSVAPPAAFGFLSASPEPIVVLGSTLRVPDAVALSVIGGDLEVRGGTLQAPSGRVTLASVAARGEVSLPEGRLPGPALDYFDQLGEIALRQGTYIGTEGKSGGTVVIRGGNCWSTPRPWLRTRWAIMTGQQWGLTWTSETE